MHGCVFEKFIAMKKLYTHILSAGLTVIVFIVYWRWFGSQAIIGGDWPYAFAETLERFSLWPQAWFPLGANGFGTIHPVLGLHAFHSFLVVVFAQWMHIPWELVYKTLWFGLFLFLSIFSTHSLVLQIGFGQMARAVVSLIYVTNTYAIMMVSGGQMGVALAYSIAPLVLSSFIALIDTDPKSEIRNSKQISSLQFVIRNSLVAGFILGVQILWDPRFAYMTLMAVGLYAVFRRKNIAFVFASGIVALALNSFWILPFALLRNNPLDTMGAAYTTVAALKFFSFADFSHALSLLSPNWPENIFGKTYFLQPEFLFIPIFAFASLLMTTRKSSRQKAIYDSRLTISFFGLLALISVFLAKGSNPPFGEVYIWLFEHVPGFVVFRDSTKFYTLVALSYAVLIPLSIQYLIVSIQGRKNKIFSLTTSYLLPAAFLFIWLFSIREAVSGKVGGTFARHQVPNEYIQVKDMLAADHGFGRTLWVPRQSRFTYLSELHPAVEAGPLLNATNAAELREVFAYSNTQEKLAQLGIGRVFIQYDALGELFLSDRKYDERVRDEWETVLDEVPWLTKVRDDKITIYETPAHKDLFWVTSGEPVDYLRYSPSHYVISVAADESRPVDLYFSQAFHPGWSIRPDKSFSYESIAAQKTANNLMKFTLPKGNVYMLDVVFTPQKYVGIGVVISLLTLGGTVLGMVLVGRVKGRV